MKISDITKYLENIAPLSYQENYDNSGLIIGDKNENVTGVIVCLDSTEEIVNEAIDKNCNLIIAHHPIIFGGLKKINGNNYIERTVIKAIKNNIAIYAIHTNLDNIINGVNGKIAERLNLINTRVLLPKNNMLKKLITYVPLDFKKAILQSLFDAGAGNIGNYSECSYSSKGTGTYLAGKNTKPYKGNSLNRHSETEERIEVIYTKDIENNVISKLIESHPYEEVAYDLIPLSNNSDKIGSGIIGELEEEISAMSFLNSLKNKMNTKCIRHTKLINKNIKTIAVCGGSGSFLLKNAISQKADIFITGDFKYHEFFDADNKIVIADIGHFESEQFTINLLVSILKEKFTTFAIHLTEKETNPVHYL